MAVALPALLTSMGVSAGTAATIGTIATIGSAVASGFSALSSFSSQNQANSYNQRIAAEQTAQTAVETRQATEQARREQYLRQGSARAAASANTGTITGSALDILGDNAAQQELDILSIKQSGLFKQNTIQQNAKLDAMRNKPSMFGLAGKLLTSGSEIATGLTDVIK